MTNYDQLVAAYEVDVRFPDVSGMEHLEGETSFTDLSRRTPTTDGQRTVGKLPAG